MQIIRRKIIGKIQIKLHYAWTQINYNINKELKIKWNRLSSLDEHPSLAKGWTLCISHIEVEKHKLTVSDIPTAMTISRKPRLSEFFDITRGDNFPILEGRRKDMHRQLPFNIGQAHHLLSSSFFYFFDQKVKTQLQVIKQRRINFSYSSTPCCTSEKPFNRERLIFTLYKSLKSKRKLWFLRWRSRCYNQHRFMPCFAKNQTLSKVQCSPPILESHESCTQ